MLMYSFSLEKLVFTLSSLPGSLSIHKCLDKQNTFLDRQTTDTSAGGQNARATP